MAPELTLGDVESFLTTPLDHVFTFPAPLSQEKILVLTSLRKLGAYNAWAFLHTFYFHAILFLVSKPFSPPPHISSSENGVYLSHWACPLAVSLAPTLSKDSDFALIHSLLIARISLPQESFPPKPSNVHYLPRPGRALNLHI